MDKSGFWLKTLASVFMVTTFVASPAMAATITVTTDSEDDAGGVECTLWEAIENANADITTGMVCAPGSGADEIVFADGVGYTLTVSGQLPAITSEVTITGRGAGTTIIQANANPDTAIYRVFEVGAAGNLTLNDLTVQNGKCAGACSTNADSGGGILNGGTLTLNRVEVLNNRSSGYGGGIYSTGTLNVTDSQIAGNQSSMEGGGICTSWDNSVATIIGSQISNNSAVSGGGVLIGNGSLTMGDSTISGNFASGDGGGFFNGAVTATITGSTINGNTATGDGGAIVNLSPLSLSDSTITGNIALGVSGAGGGAIYQFSEGSSPELYLTNVTLAGNNHETAGGDGIYLSDGPAFIGNSIIAGNGTENCGWSAGLILTNGNNLEDTNTCMFGGGDLVDSDPLLGALADNGGSTQTMALLPGSPAINAAANTSCRDYDQRGELRPYEGQCDIGAYEYQGQGGPGFVVNTDADTDDGLCSVADCSLREAIDASNSRPGADTISFDGYYTITLDGSQLPVVEGELAITGNGVGSTILQASTCDPVSGGCTPADYRVLQLSAAGNLTLDGVTVRHGVGDGGAIYSEGTLLVKNSRIEKNVGTDYGSGIFSWGTVSVLNTTFSGNSTGEGALASFGNATVDSSTFENNTMTGGGGAIYNELNTTLDVTNSTFAYNTADQGGAIHARGVTTISNSTFAYNSATYLGNAVHAWKGSLLLYNNIMTSNSGGAARECEDSESAAATVSVNNLIDDGSCGASLTSDPLLGPLADNGGSTLTFAIPQSSPAFDAGDDATCTTTDQRGISRYQGSHCDIGSYEFYEIDSDGDGVLDNADNCPAVANPDQLNTDGDAPGDACDDDDDDDGIPDAYEDAYGMDSKDPDDIYLDNDGDGFSNQEEYNAGSAANDATSSVGLLSLSAASYSVYEGGSLTITVTRSGGTVGVVGIGCATSGGTASGGGTDYYDIEDYLEWSDGEGGSKSCAPIATVDDGLGDPDETFFVDLYSPYLAHLGSPTSATVTIKEFIDSDGDTIGDDVDNCPALANSEQLDTDGDSIGDACDSDDDNDGVLDGDDAFQLDASEWLDTDGDGTGNNADTDDDNDGVLDGDDAFQLDASEWLDTDGDGIGNNADTDDDDDGVLDGEDAFPLDATESIDTDSDGTGDNADSDDDGDGVADGSDAFPLDASESVDTDGDGIGNNADSDDDGDGVADGSDAFPLDATESVDTDGDGTGDNADNDDDGDGVADSSDAFPLDASESVDTDGDGIGNNADTDDDADGVGDSLDQFPLDGSEQYDTDGDGIGNNADSDDDGDGVLDVDDASPLGVGEGIDTDGDGAGDTVDSDDDNDGVADTEDAFPLDAGESVDSDGDGIGNNTDSDDDNDGVADTDDAFPLDATESADTDGDGIGNNADTDDDNDGVADTQDAFPEDPSESMDSDGDGIGDNQDTVDDSAAAAATSSGGGGGGGTFDPLLLLLMGVGLGWLRRRDS